MVSWEYFERSDEEQNINFANVDGDPVPGQQQEIPWPDDNVLTDEENQALDEVENNSSIYVTSFSNISFCINCE